MTTEPYASANRVFWVVDNGWSHRGQTSIDVQNRLMAFQDLYSAAARPFNWKYATSDLNALLARIAAHERNSPLALAA